jgi:hypothetical protein
MTNFFALKVQFLILRGYFLLIIKVLPVLQTKDHFLWASDAIVSEIRLLSVLEDSVLAIEAEFTIAHVCDTGVLEVLNCLQLIHSHFNGSSSFWTSDNNGWRGVAFFRANLTLASAQIFQKPNILTLALCTLHLSLADTIDSSLRL